MPNTLKDKILFKRAELESNIIDNTTLQDETIHGEIILCYENGKEKLYTKNSDGLLVPIHNVLDGKEIEKPVESVDLGLPSGLKWARCNIGANSEDEAGLYFQWGDTQGYTAEQVGKDKNFPINFSDYKFGIDGSLTNFTKYNESDGKTVLDLEDDAAHYHLGEGWRMPTSADFVELCQNTDMFIIPTEGEEVAVTVTENSSYPIYFEFNTATTTTAKAFKFYKKGDHSTYISVPFVGDASDRSVRYVGKRCNIWSSSLNSADSSDAFFLFCNAPVGLGLVSNNIRCIGMPVRGIHS